MQPLRSSEPEGPALGRVLDDRSQAVEVRIGPLSADEAAACVRSSQIGRLVEQWAEALLPVSRPWHIRWMVNPDPPFPELGAEDPQAILGVSARLSGPASREEPAGGAIDGSTTESKSVSTTSK